MAHWDQVMVCPLCAIIKLHQFAVPEYPTWTPTVVSIVGVLAQFLWEAQAHKVSGRYIIGNC